MEEDGRGSKGNRTGKDKAKKENDGTVGRECDRVRLTNKHPLSRNSGFTNASIQHYPPLYKQIVCVEQERRNRNKQSNIY